MPVICDSVQEIENVCQNQQTFETEDMALELNASEPVNYGVSCSSRKGRGLKKGLVSVEDEILRLFESLDMERQKWVAARLAEMVGVEVDLVRRGERIAVRE